jgi:hypothetical protein
MSKVNFESDFQHHPMHYFTLLCIFLIGLWGIFWFCYRPATQLSIIIVISGAYVLWGIYHHRQHRDLHLKIIFEYLLVAILGILFFGSLLLRA